MSAPGVIRGLGPGGRPGLVDYRLARRNLIDGFRKGRVARNDVCDAHPELIRAATNIGDPIDGEPCPICEEVDLVHVRYVFGPRLPKHGRCVADQAEMAKLAARAGDVTCYVVEVCRSCHWNHLARSHELTSVASKPTRRRR
ncbi:MAG TPA: DUF5318 family protein [Acidimicrobiales bacterium]